MANDPELEIVEPVTAADKMAFIMATERLALRLIEDCAATLSSPSASKEDREEEIAWLANDEESPVPFTVAMEVVLSTAQAPVELELAVCRARERLVGDPAGFLRDLRAAHASDLRADDDGSEDEEAVSAPSLSLRC